MQETLHKMKEFMELRGLSKGTQKTYLRYVEQFGNFCGKPFEEIDYSDIREFLLDLIQNRKFSPSFVNCHHSAIRFLYQAVFQRDWNVRQLPRVKKKNALPVVISKDEVLSIINSTSNLKHKAILSTVYSGGLRVSEAAHLKISDIDSSNMRIWIRHGKGGKDRFTLLSHNNLILLREYFKAYRPKDWLFPGYPSTESISPNTIQAIFKNAVSKAGIKKNITIHTLRHCFATHLLNSGANLLQIKELLGHSDIKSTCIYLHLSNAEILNIKNPLDLQGGDFNA